MPIQQDLSEGGHLSSSPDGSTAIVGTTLPSTDEKWETCDPNVVGWDGPNDPENPLNWTSKKKWLNIAVLSILSFITPLGSSMFAPSITEIMVEFNSTSNITATFILSIYVLGFAFGPLIIAPLSEIFGRAPLYNVGNFLFTIFTIAGALSTNLGMLMAFRLLMGLAGSVPITIGSGTIADTMPLEQRGRAMAIWILGPLFGPSVGPVAGGYLAQAAGWRWIFWLQAILSGLLIPVAIFGMKETYAPVILRRKLDKLHKETGNDALHIPSDDNITLKERFKVAIVRPLKLLVLVPVISLMALYVAVEYGIMYLLMTTFSIVYEGQYGFSTGTSGLSYLPIGIGMLIGVAVFGKLSDHLVRQNQAKGNQHRAEIRLAPLFTIPCGIAIPAGLFIYGWTTDKQVHWIASMIGIAIFGAGLMAIMMCVQNYLLDAFPEIAASVTASITVLRSIAGALLPLCGLQMYESLGLGWGNSLLAFVSLGLVPIPLAFYVFGERLRKMSND
ncbi:hypothetical protein E8E14_005080 [Neopestalotiopsis sp. 37M]|nr:hypothetical protein E8E14_005080 [Neopestalotiopsis sp. 37M]